MRSVRHGAAMDCEWFCTGTDEEQASATRLVTAGFEHLAREEGAFGRSRRIWAANQSTERRTNTAVWSCSATIMALAVGMETGQMSALSLVAGAVVVWTGSAWWHTHRWRPAREPVEAVMSDPREVRSQCLRQRLMRGLICLVMAFAGAVMFVTYLIPDPSLDEKQREHVLAKAREGSTPWRFWEWPLTAGDGPAERWQEEELASQHEKKERSEPEARQPRL